MKKLYTLLITILALNLTASAADWDIVLKVTEGADRVKAVIGASETNGAVRALVNGDNQIIIPEDQSLYIIPQNENDIIIFKDSDGDDIEKSYYGYYEIYASSWRSPYSPYTLTVKDESSYRTKSVSVKIDDCSKVSIVRGDGKEFDPDTNSFAVSYNPENESKLTIKPRSYRDIIYKVSVNGKDVEKSSDRFVVDLVDNSGAEPSYVETVDVAANFPEGLKFKTVVTLNGPTEMISYVRINNKDVDDIAACLTADGFEANPGDNIAIGYNTDYKIDAVSDNGESKSVFSQYSIEQIDKDHNVEITGHAYALFNVKFDVTGAEGIIGSFGSTTLKLSEGENTPKISEKNNYITFSAAPGWYFETFTDAAGTDYLSLSDWEYYGKVYLTVKEGDSFSIVAKKIRRDNTLVVFYDDFSALSFSYFKTKFKNYDELPDEITPGYNVINFRDEDGYFSVFASGSYDGFYAYKNDEFMNPSYEGAKYFEDEAVADKDIYKIFFVNEPTVHSVTFTVSDNALDGYDVKKDLIADVDYTAAVKAVGKTRFTISPVSSDVKSITVIVGDNEIKAVDGVYTFDTESDTGVSVAATSSIEDILAESDGNADVYNLQGIRVFRGATADDIAALPAGIYIINGTKIAVK